jgi:hypothetical protein
MTYLQMRQLSLVTLFLKECKGIQNFKMSHHHHHHLPINVPTAGAQAFLMDYPQGGRDKENGP